MHPHPGDGWLVGFLIESLGQSHCWKSTFREVAQGFCLQVWSKKSCPKQKQETLRYPVIHRETWLVRITSFKRCFLIFQIPFKYNSKKTLGKKCETMWKSSKSLRKICLKKYVEKKQTVAPKLEDLKRFTIQDGPLLVINGVVTPINVSING